MAFSAHFHSADQKHGRGEFIQRAVLFSGESLVSANYISASWLHFCLKKKKFKKKKNEKDVSLKLSHGGKTDQAQYVLR